MPSLNECRATLRSIISDMRSIEADIRSSGYGLGQDLCADCVQRVADRYENNVLSRLNRVDSNRLADWVNGED